jgi:hypothetical protein
MKATETKLRDLKGPKFNCRGIESAAEERPNE